MIFGRKAERIEQETDLFEPLSIGLYRKLVATPPRSNARGRIVLVSSAREGEGKTHIASRVARYFGKMFDAPVALIDANPVAPATHVNYRIQPTGGGLFDCLAAGHLIEEQLVHSIHNVDVLPTFSGARLALLARSEAARRILDNLRKRYPVTVIDGPQLHQCGCLTHETDGTLLVIDSSRTRREVVMGAMASPHVDRNRVLGVALNRRKHYVPSWVYRGAL